MITLYSSIKKYVFLPVILTAIGFPSLVYASDLSPDSPDVSAKYPMIYQELNLDKDGNIKNFNGHHKTEIIHQTLPFEIKINPGMALGTGASSNTENPLNNTAFLQAAGHYYLNDWFSVGGQVGYIFGKTIDDGSVPGLSYSSDILEGGPSFEVGPWIDVDGDAVRFYGILDGGIYNVKAKADFMGSSIFSQSANYAGIAPGLGTAYHFMNNGIFGVEVRYHTVFDRNQTFNFFTPTLFVAYWL